MIIGVDPGASGALALMDRGRVITIMDMPTGEIMVGKSKRRRISPEMLAGELGEWFRFIHPTVAYVEEVTAMPKQGVSSVFTFGQAHGMILGALAMADVRLVRIRPQAWQKKVKARGDPRVRALELHPYLRDQMKRKKDEGRADAVLIAHAGWLLEEGRDIA